MRYVVGYTANARGGDAVNLAVALARRQGATLDLVMVMPLDSPYNGVYPPEAGFGSILARQVAEWLDEGLARRTSKRRHTSAGVNPRHRNSFPQRRNSGPRCWSLGEVVVACSSGSPSARWLARSCTPLQSLWCWPPRGTAERIRSRA